MHAAAGRALAVMNKQYSTIRTIVGASACHAGGVNVGFLYGTVPGPATRF